MLSKPLCVPGSCTRDILIAARRRFYQSQRHLHRQFARRLSVSVLAALQHDELSTTAVESPAVQATLATLGWPPLCEFVARFASTTLGRKAVQHLNLPQAQLEIEVLVKETAAVDKLETEYAVELDFGGTSTSQVRCVGTAPPSFCIFGCLAREGTVRLFKGLATGMLHMHCLLHAP